MFKQGEESFSGRILSSLVGRWILGFLSTYVSVYDKANEVSINTLQHILFKAESLSMFITEIAQPWVSISSKADHISNRWETVI